ncbi:MAG: DUF4142 domain-containing protein [Herminiimonas sp.]|nr:DUF4142 domain-containing protein [Herminiimonas sp.]
MNASKKVFDGSKLVFAAAVLSTFLAGCNRQASTDQAAAGSGSSAMTGSDASRAAPGTMAAANGPSAASSASDAAAAANDAARIGAGVADTPGTSSGAVAAGSGASGAAMVLSDSQIQGILMTANTAEVDAGKMAQSKSQNAKVKEFASSMVKEHTTVNQQVAALAKKNNTSPAESDVTISLKADAEKSSASLKAMSGSGFDKTYVDAQVADHEKVLRTIDTMLLPNAKDPGLKQLIEKVRPSVSMHLDHAKMLQASVK